MQTAVKHFLPRYDSAEFYLPAGMLMYRSVTVFTCRCTIHILYFSNSHTASYLLPIFYFPVLFYPSSSSFLYCHLPFFCFVLFSYFSFLFLLIFFSLSFFFLSSSFPPHSLSFPSHISPPFKFTFLQYKDHPF